MTAQQRAAIIRAAWTAIGTAAVTFLTSVQVGGSVRDAGITAAIAALSVLGFRGGIEGAMDTGRAERGDVRESDVGFRINVHDPSTWGD